MDLGTALAFALVIIILIFIGLIALAVWLSRIGNRNPSAARVFSALPALPALVVFGIFFYAYVMLPLPVTKGSLGVRQSEVFAVQGQDVYLLTGGISNGISIGVFNRQQRKFTPIAELYGDNRFNDALSSLAWDGRNLAITINNDSHYVVVIRDRKLVKKLSFNKDVFISRDKQNGKYYVAEDYYFHDRMMFHELNADFEVSRRDTFFLDDDRGEELSFGAESLQRIGDTWYANHDKQTYILNFAHDTVYYTSANAGGMQAASLYGGLGKSGSRRWLLTDKGIHDTGLPESNRVIPFWDQGVYYRLQGDSASWRAVQSIEDSRGSSEFYFAEGEISFHESCASKDLVSYIELKYPGAEPLKMRLLNAYRGAHYSDQMVFITKDSLEIYRYGLNNYAIFDTLSGDRIDSGDRQSRLSVFLHEDFLVIISVIVFVLCLLWLAGFIYCTWKKKTKILFPFHIYALIVFFAFGLPYLVILIANFGRW